MRTSLFVALAAMLATAAQAQTAVPAGPSSLQETYRDWSVVCVQQEAQRRCAMTQQLSQQDGRRVLALELSTDAGGETATGLLVLPFGLALDEGVTLTVDEAAPERLRFRTCLPAGCVVPLTLDAPALMQLRTGKALNLSVAASDTGDAVEFKISLDGFDAAFARLVGLSASP
jgi:invasion protein IalB